jgi:hypothetical protein
MSAGKRTKIVFSAQPTPRRRRGGQPILLVMRFLATTKQDQNLYVYSRPMSIRGFSGLLVFWSAPLPTGDQQSRSPAVHVQNLGLLLSTIIAGSR